MASFVLKKERDAYNYCCHNNALKITGAFLDNGEAELVVELEDVELTALCEISIVGSLLMPVVTP